MKRVRVDGELGDVVTDLILDDADVTAQRLLDTDSHKRVKSTNASSYVAGTANQITVTPSSGGVTLSIPADVITTPANTASWSIGNAGGTKNAAFNVTSGAASLYLTHPTATQVVADTALTVESVSGNLVLKADNAGANAELDSGSSGYVYLKNGTTARYTQSPTVTTIANGTISLQSGSDLTLQASTGTQYVILRQNATDVVKANTTTTTVAATNIVLNGTTTKVQAGGVDKLVVNSYGVALGAGTVPAQTGEGNIIYGGLSLSGKSGVTPYTYLTMSGGNSYGYMYGAYNAHGDGVHLTYNYYHDNTNPYIFNAGGATSKITATFGEVGAYVGAVNTAPNQQRMLLNYSNAILNSDAAGTVNLRVGGSDKLYVDTNNATISVPGYFYAGAALGMILPQAASDPVTAVGNIARMYYNTTSNTVKISNGTAWKTLTWS